LTELSVLVTVPWGARLGGAEEMLWLWLRHASGTGVEPRLVFFEDGPFPEETAALGVDTDVVPTGRLRQPGRVAGAVGALAARIRRERPDVILNWVAKAQVYGGAAALRAGHSERTLWWQHGVPHGHWLDRLATAVPARAVGCSSAAAAARQAAMRPRRPTFVVHPGVDIDRIDQAGAPTPLPAAADGRIVLGIVGRLQPWKGQHHFLRALAALRASGHDVHGLLVGGEAHGFSAGYGAELERLTRDLDLTDAVTMTGQVPDAGPYIDSMDVLVNASENEPFGIVLIEAMARGVPVVAVADAGPREIVVPEETGILIPRPDATLLADVLDRLVADGDLRSRLGAEGRRRAIAHFGAARMAEDLAGQLTRVAGLARPEPASLQPVP
jgi:glycosyltransferase involved in cell wall biosynthesis